MQNHLAASRRYGAAALALSLSAAAVLLSGGTANAAIVPTVPLATAAQYNILAGSTVTNTGTSTIPLSVGVHAGTATPGILDGDVGPPGVVHRGDATALIAKNNLTAAYNNAAGRPGAAYTGADLANQHLQAGVYAVNASRGAMQLNGPLVLDGAGNRNSVFIFQTDSSLDTGTGSTVQLINGAQECNVFWQVGSSATLGTGSTMRGNIMADQSISLADSVTVHGRTLASVGAVTLIGDTFTAPTCQLTGAVPGFPATPVTTPATTPAGGGGGSAATPEGTGTSGGTGTGTGTGTDTTGGGTATGLTNGVPGVSGPPRTGGAPLQSGGSIPWLPALFAVIVIGAGATDLVVSRRAHARRSAVVDPTDPDCA
jgi:Ice-binding-like